MTNLFVVLSGCSGGGKSTLLGELRARGYAAVEEPGRRIVREEKAARGTALRWVDLAAFARRAIEVATGDLDIRSGRPGWVFFDRGLVDAAAALEYATSEPALSRLGGARHYNHTVFFTPPWPDLFASDAERNHDLDDAVAEYGRLEQAYAELGYQVLVLPRVSVSARADMVLKTLGAPVA